MNKIAIISLLMLLCLGCEKAKYTPIEVPTSEDALSPLVKEALDKKYDKYKKTIHDRCKAKALKEAIAHIDSVIVQELKLKHVDELSFPQRPSRPRLPEGIILNDSTEIAPIQ